MVAKKTTTKKTAKKVEEKMRYTLTFLEFDGELKSYDCDKWITNQIYTDEDKSIPLALMLDEEDDSVTGKLVDTLVEIKHNKGGKKFFDYMYETMFMDEDGEVKDEHVDGYN